MSARLAVLLVACALGPTAASAQSISASARVAPTVVRVGERVAYTLTVRGASVASLAAPPATGGLRPTQTLPTSDVQTQISGQARREITWTYEATRAGPARIGPYRADVGGGRALEVAAASVRVEGGAVISSPGTVIAAPGERSDLFARLELSRTDAVVGQQVVADIVLYFLPSLQPRQTMVTGSWDAPGFWREEMDLASTVPRPVTIGGRAYEAVTLRRLGLFPTRTGRLELPPMRFSVDLVRFDAYDDPFGGFFRPFSSGYEQRDVTTPTASLDVSALPAGAPAGFGGAVGQFTMSAAPVARAVAAGDPVQIRVSVAGTGNIATLDAPALIPPPGIDAFRPRDEATVDRSGREVRGDKTFTYTLVPQGGGRFDVPPAVWSYYEPEAGAYRTLRTDTLRLDVAGAPVAGPASPTAVAGEAAGLLASPRWSRPGLPVGILWGVLGIGLGAPAVALAGAALVRHRRRRASADTPEMRRRHALARARQRLGAARGLRGPEAYAAAERAVHTFLSDRYDLTATGVDRDALAAALAALGVPAAPRLLALADALDAGQFAPGLAPLSEAAALDEAASALALADGPAPPRRRRFRRAAVAAVAAVCLAGPAHAQTLGEADRLFALGLQLVAEGDTSGATAAFDGAISTGAEAGRRSASAEHNLGALALARGDAGRARLHTERAARLAPLDAAVAQNATLARQVARAAPEAPLARAWRVVQGVAGPTGLVALALALAYAGLALSLGGRRRAVVPVGVIALVAVSAAVAALVGASRSEGVVLTATELREAPAPDASRQGAFAPGALVHLGERRGAWQHVSGDGADGWAPASSVAPLGSPDR